MDVHLRFWCDEEGSVQTRYFESRFLKGTNAETISQELIQSLSEMPEAKSTSISVDGPITNWSVMDKLNENMGMKMNFHLFFGIGSCGLHVVHGTFKTGVIATNWELDKALHALCKLLNDSPARRDGYKTVNRTS